MAYYMTKPLTQALTITAECIDPHPKSIPNHKTKFLTLKNHFKQVRPTKYFGPHKYSGLLVFSPCN